MQLHKYKLFRHIISLIENEFENHLAGHIPLVAMYNLMQRPPYPQPPLLLHIIVVAINIQCCVNNQFLSLFPSMVFDNEKSQNIGDSHSQVHTCPP